MKLKKISIRGFRSLKDVSWEPGDLNVLIGPNGSGKSNLLRALELLREAGTEDLDDALATQGGWMSVCWDQTGKLEWELEIDPQSWISNDVEILRYELFLEGSFSSYQINHELLADYTKVKKRIVEKPFKYLERDRKSALVVDSNENIITVDPERLKRKLTLMSQAPRIISTDAVFWFSDYLKTDWGIYQNLTVQQECPARKAAITRNETKLSSAGDNLVTVLHTLYTIGREFKTKINDAMQAAFGQDFEELEFPPAEDQRIQLKVRWKSLRYAHSAAELSEGTLRFLMLIAILVGTSQQKLIGIDEPETYLHPSMFPIIAELAAEASKTSQIIFTTHSPEFLTALGIHNPTTAVLQNVNGETKLNVLDQQEMKRWLEKYKLGELFVAGDLEALV